MRNKAQMHDDACNAVLEGLRMPCRSRSAVAQECGDQQDVEACGGEGGLHALISCMAQSAWAKELLDFTSPRHVLSCHPNANSDICSQHKGSFPGERHRTGQKRPKEKATCRHASNLLLLHQGCKQGLLSWSLKLLQHPKTLYNISFCCLSRAASYLCLQSWGTARVVGTAKVALYGTGQAHIEEPVTNR